MLCRLVSTIAMWTSGWVSTSDAVQVGRQQWRMARARLSHRDALISGPVGGCSLYECLSSCLCRKTNFIKYTDRFSKYFHCTLIMQETGPYPPRLECVDLVNIYFSKQLTLIFHNKVVWRRVYGGISLICKFTAKCAIFRKSVKVSWSSDKNLGLALLDHSLCICRVFLKFACSFKSLIIDRTK